MLTASVAPAGASIVYASKSPVPMVPRYVVPLVAGPPSSPAAMLSARGALATLMRYSPAPAPGLVAATTVYVPDVAAVPATCAAAVPELAATCAPPGAYTRIHGPSVAPAITSPMATAKNSPAAATNVHVSVSVAGEIRPRCS